jgi:hypothetical protein
MERLLEEGSLKGKLQEDIFLKHNMIQTETRESFFNLLQTEISTRKDILETLFTLEELKGKLLNTRDTSIKQITNNQEITNIKKILGLESRKKYKDIYASLP